MIPRLPWGPILTLGLCLLAVVILLARLQPGPGPLSPVHAREPLLSAASGCHLCHGEGGKVAMASACGACHGRIAEQVATRRGFHGSLDPGRGRDCGYCHLEHLGDAMQAVSAASWRRAGIADISSYDHAGLSMNLEGRHRALDCEACHRDCDAAVVAKGRTRYGGVGTLCTGCHQDPHKGSYGSRCDTCHGQEHTFKSVAGFRHTDRFPLIGAHAAGSCGTCHAKDGATSIGDLIAKPVRASIPVRACGDCHASPHSTGFLEAVSRPAAVPVSQSCALCHDPRHRSWQAPAAVLTREQHALAGVPLKAPHDIVACEGCHAGLGRRESVARAADPAAAYRKIYPGRDMGRCVECHADPHQGQFASAACVSCHKADAFTPHAFDVAAHDRTAFALIGRHRTVDCNACHARAELEPRRFRGVPTSCTSCHRDPHEGQFGGRGCSSCHGMDSFRPTTYAEAAHAKSSFPLTGSHRAVACSACHDVPKGKPASGRRFVGTNSSCASCHRDVHEGRFDGPDRPAKVGGAEGCARCHSTASFRALERTFDHAVWTSYPLTGAHTKLDCAACHQRLDKPDAAGRTLASARGTTCRSCHADPHVAQFGGPAVVRCDRCHTTEGRFKPAVFDHQKDSRFPLDKTHEKLACAACHKTVDLPGGGKAVRYKPLGTKCGDCHVVVPEKNP